MNVITQVEEARQLLKQGKIVAYPTEAVYGLGCDPFNKPAVEKLLALKQRSMSKGFILLIADWAQLTSLVMPVPEHLLDNVRKTWPGPVTWVFPKAASMPEWLSGQHATIAIRMSAHPIASQLCLDGPVISTSANISGFKPAVDATDLSNQFPEGIDALLVGSLGESKQPSAIFDVLSGSRLR